VNMSFSALRFVIVSAIAVVAAGAIGVVLALSGTFSRPEVIDYVAIAQTSDDREAAAHSCVDGPIVAALPAGQRVLVVAQSADAAWVGVRNPVSVDETLWLPQSAVTLDSGELDGSWPVGGGCPTVVVTRDVTAPVVVVPPASTMDTTAPTLGSATATPDPVGCVPPDPIATVTVTASDDNAVTSVAISWTGAAVGQASMGGSGASWTYAFDPPDTTFGSVTFHIVARDAAGNVSTESAVSVFVDCVL
jgi:Bacterial Ig-like domain